jgi:hypothetical protein
MATSAALPASAIPPTILAGAAVGGKNCKGFAIAAAAVSVALAISLTLKSSFSLAFLSAHNYKKSAKTVLALH